MPISSVERDVEELTMTVVADFPVPVSRLWDAYVDPRQLEKFWGPPMWPATFTQHDVFPGGRSAYAMTGPEGERSQGYWEFIRVEPLKSFEVLDGFANDDGTPNLEMPNMRMVFQFDATSSGSRLITTTYFNSLAELEQLIGMGMEEGMRQAMGQIDEVLADLRSFAADQPTRAQQIGELTLRTSRIIRGSVGQVWAAHHDPVQVAAWMTGPDGWSMPTCETGSRVGECYRYVWREDSSGVTFWSTGEILQSSPPHREVFTERMEGEVIPEPTVTTTNELTLTPLSEGTLLAIVTTYPDEATLNAVLGTGMVAGMETSYLRLEQVLAER